MQGRNYSYFFSFAILLFFGMLGFSGNAQAACTLQGEFSINGVQGTPGWYTDPPTSAKSVTARVNLSDCAGKNVQIKIMNKPGNATATTLHTFGASVPSTSNGTAQFTYPFKVGETGCQNGVGGLACHLYLTGDVDGGQVMTTYATPANTSSSGPDGVLAYSCYVSCDQPFNEGGSWPTFTPPAWSGGTTGTTGSGLGTVNFGDDFKELRNPIQYDNIPDVIRQLITIVFVIGIPLVALAIIYAGFLLVTAGGNQEKIKKGKQALLAAVIGGAILLGAWVIAEAIQGTVNQIRGV